MLRQLYIYWWLHPFFCGWKCYGHEAHMGLVWNWHQICSLILADFVVKWNKVKLESIFLWIHVVVWKIQVILHACQLFANIHINMAPLMLDSRSTKTLLELRTSFNTQSNSNAEYKWDLRFYCEDFGKNWLRYNGTALYIYQSGTKPNLVAKILATKFGSFLWYI